MSKKNNKFPVRKSKYADTNNWDILKEDGLSDEEICLTLCNNRMQSLEDEQRVKFIEEKFKSIYFKDTEHLLAYAEEHYLKYKSYTEIFDPEKD